MARIELPPFITAAGAKTHAYPFQVGLQTQEFIQGTFFLGAFSDIAAGRQVRNPGGLESVNAELERNGLERDAIDQAWEVLGKHIEVHRKWLFQNVLILAISHWDWYIRKLASFCEFALQNEDPSGLSNRTRDRLRKVGFKGFVDQLRLVETTVGEELSIEESNRELLAEMVLVRNLGMHNRWEVDEKYLADSSCHRFSLGEIRIFDSVELQAWHGALIAAISATTRAVGMRFRTAPGYP